MNTTLGIETPWQTPWPGLHWAPISEKQGKAGSQAPLITAASEPGPFRLRKFCPAGSWTGNPGLWRNSRAASAWGILSHSHLQAPISGSCGQGISTPPAPEGKGTGLVSQAPGTLLQRNALGLWGTSQPPDVQRQSRLPTAVCVSQAHVPSNARSGFQVCHDVEPTLPGMAEWGPHHPQPQELCLLTKGNINLVSLSMVSQKSFENTTFTSFCFIFIICETGVMIPNSRMAGITA